MHFFNEHSKKYFIKEGIIYKKNITDKTTKKVTDFYKVAPFPNYKSNDNKATILEKGDRNFLSSEFKKLIGYKKNILEVGCGTGQMSNYFAIGTNNYVVGLDPTIESLKLASDFVEKNNIDNIEFINADIFDDVLKKDFFDFIWCNGVLHHTKDPYSAFEITVKSLKKEGFILLGLYNKIGRIRTIIRRYIYKIFGKNFLMLFDPTLRNLKESKEEQLAWIRDQYTHPVESLHTIDQVLNWFKKNNIEFINSIPSSDFELNEFENIFEKRSTGSKFSRLLNQIFMTFGSLGSDGGLFIVIGKKNNF